MSGRRETAPPARGARGWAWPAAGPRGRCRAPPAATTPRRRVSPRRACCCARYQPCSGPAPSNRAGSAPEWCRLPTRTSTTRCPVGQRPVSRERIGLVGGREHELEPPVVVCQTGDEPGTERQVAPADRPDNRLLLDVAKGPREHVRVAVCSIRGHCSNRYRRGLWRLADPGSRPASSVSRSAPPAHVTSRRTQPR